MVGGEVNGRRATAAMLASVLIYAATTRTSLFGTCESMAVTDDNTLRDHLNRLAKVDEIWELAARINEQLVVDLPQILLDERREVAIDFHDMPHYGKHADLQPWVCRGEARPGTTRFIRIATIYVLRPGIRVTLAMTPVTPAMAAPVVISSLVQTARRARVRINRLWLERGFAACEVVQRIKALRLAAVIA